MVLQVHVAHLLPTRMTSSAATVATNVVLASAARIVLVAYLRRRSSAVIGRSTGWESNTNINGPADVRTFGSQLDQLSGVGRVDYSTNAGIEVSSRSTLITTGPPGYSNVQDPSSPVTMVVSSSWVDTLTVTAPSP